MSPSDGNDPAAPGQGWVGSQLPASSQLLVLFEAMGGEKWVSSPSPSTVYIRILPGFHSDLMHCVYRR